MNCADMTAIKLDTMRKHVDLAQQNERALAGHPDIYGQLVKQIRERDVVWAVWPNDRADGLLGHGLALLKGQWTMMAHYQAGVAAHVEVVRLMLPSFEAASQMCALYGDDSPQAEVKVP